MNNLINVPKSGNLTNTNSNVDLTNLSTWLNDIFNRNLPSVFNTNFNTGIALPKVNIKDTADSYIIEMAVPSLKKSDFRIDLNNDVLAISTKVKEESKQKNEKYTRREFNYSSFKRTFNLPESVNNKKINANYQEGILSVFLPKKEEAKRKLERTIKIS
ncbi:Hsp20/alpha crystallin family protein [Lutibacter sp. A80]|uniref:Hsp20/alpha crystallin family protein n=1 Tax=Lutibacter sp. A80 TaxID=2918453 RepID=UPI001F05F506|nr:Hsp20/alpha crystallin family protein [Lutibacter sp. A80]UMB60748.1 Hsp20/alpha crystallin family protein [Lutibacter sp. A80]